MGTALDCLDSLAVVAGHCAGRLGAFRVGASDEAGDAHIAAAFSEELKRPAGFEFSEIVRVEPHRSRAVRAAHEAFAACGDDLVTGDGGAAGIGHDLLEIAAVRHRGRAAPGARLGAAVGPFRQTAGRHIHHFEQMQRQIAKVVDCEDRSGAVARLLVAPVAAVEAAGVGQAADQA